MFTINGILNCIIRFFDETGEVRVTDILEAVAADEQAEENTHDFDIKEIEKTVSENYDNYYKRTYNKLFNYLAQKYNIELIGDHVDSHINTIMFQGKKKILKFITEDESTLSLERSMELHLDMSDTEIAPYIHVINILDYKIRYLYIIMDYVNMSLEDVKKEDTKLYNQLVIRKNKLLKRINKKGWENIDDHDGNYLYDKRNDKLYVIDYTDWQKVKK